MYNWGFLVVYMGFGMGYIGWRSWVGLGQVGWVDIVASFARLEMHFHGVDNFGRFFFYCGVC